MMDGRGYQCLASADASGMEVLYITLFLTNGDTTQGDRWRQLELMKPSFVDAWWSSAMARRFASARQNPR